jgi:hypothetical protein
MHNSIVALSYSIHNLSQQLLPLRLVFDQVISQSTRVYVCTYVYVCTHVRVYTYMYVCMYVCKAVTRASSVAR